MSQTTNMLILVGVFGFIAFGFIYLARKETEKMKARNYKKFKGEKLLREQLR